MWRKQFVRFCSYKAIRRPNLKAGQKQPPQKVENKSTASLSEILQAQIKTTGPITVAEYMQKVLTNPVSGYYMTKDVFGREGDFITSPEINQIFGELIAIWCMMEHEKIGSPSPVQLIELGPGRGTLTQDILRVLSQFKFQSNLSIHLVEISPFLAQAQASRICYRYREADDPESTCYQEGETVSGIKIFWYKQLKDVPKEFSIFIAHEFFDALPIHKLQKSGDLWKEILIDIDPNSKDMFRFVTSRSETPISKIVSQLFDQNGKREQFEYSPESHRILSEITDRMESDGGFGLVMDYGHLGDKGDTFRAFKNHNLHDPLLEPGAADLTADVDFSQFKSFIRKDGKCCSYGPIRQHDFIKRLGGDARLKILLEKASNEQKEAIKSGYEMLTDLQQMGDRFKFLSIYPKVLEEHLKRFPPTGLVE